MLSDLKAFLGRYLKKDILSLEMDSSGIRFVKINRESEGKLSLGPYYFHPLLEEEFGDPQREALKEFLRVNKFSGMNVASNMEDRSLKIRRIEVPKMPEYDLVEAVKWNMRDVIDGPIEEYTIRHTHLEELTAGESKRLSLVAYAIRTEAVQQKVEWLRSLGLNPTILEPNAVALLAAFDCGHQWQKGDYHVLIHLGWEKSLFVVVGQGRLYFSRLLEGVSVKACLENISKACHLSEKESTQMKSLCGQKGGNIKGICGNQPNFQSALDRDFHQFSLNIQSSIDSFSVLFHIDKVDSIFLSGCGAYLPNIESYFEKNIGVPTQHWRIPPLGEKGFQGLDSYFTIALGLALPQEYS